MKKMLLISEKELIENLSKKVFLVFVLFFIMYAGYLNFLSLDIYSNISVNIEISPQLIMSADPNQGIISPLFSNFFLFFLLIFPVIVSTALSSEKDNNTYEILKLKFNDFSIITGKFLAYFFLSFVFFLITFLLLLPYIISGGFLDITYIINLIIGFVSISVFWISFALLISSISPSYLSFYIIIVFNIIVLIIDFISDIVNFPLLEFIKNLSPYHFYDIILKGIMNLKFIIGYIITGIFLFTIILFINQRKKWFVFFLSAGLWIISLFFLSGFNRNFDLTFNKINSLSKNSIKYLNTIKNKDITVNLYIRKHGPKWQSANDLIKLFKLNFDNIKFNFIDPSESEKEYGTIEFIYNNNKVEQLSIDEDVFTESIYYVATGKKIKVNVKKISKGKPYKFKKKYKILYFIWILFICFSIFLIRKIFLKGGIK